ncbi:hypothetical protein K470DRAFT_215115 [Piedraia hortae CBS 480.64]|uniref:Tim44-like domain-containing protein n=1 Tax=Piedraia hortae CBS 480.64 TaxID=1314780 RepID=A0A6A7C3J0_9PEZI|nr:hypothetical protein K470DRAFT_215115 [Piedraia hortae CBS 480.64]
MKCFGKVNDRDRLFYYKYLFATPRPVLGVGNIASTAKQLHEEMYTQLAKGDLAPVEKVLCDGIAKSLQSRVSSRPRNQIMEWTCHSHVKRPRIVSLRQSPLPVFMGKSEKGKRVAIVQAVVRLHTVQSLMRRSKDGKKGWIQDKPKERIEYLVLQRMMRNSIQGPWKVWGTTEETRPETLLQLA